MTTGILIITRMIDIKTALDNSHDNFAHFFKRKKPS